MRIKYSLLLLIVFLTNGCMQNKSSNFDKKNGYSCIVRVDLKWKNNVPRYERDNLIRRFADDGLFESKGKDLISFTLNNNDEIMHIDYTNDVKCKQKYKETKRILDAYLKPLPNSPKYEITRRTLSKDEFNNLNIKMVE